MPTETLYDSYNDQFVSHTWTAGAYYDRRFDIWSTLAPDPSDPVSIVNGLTYNARFDAFIDANVTPTAPANFAAVPSSGQVALSWDAISGVDGYRVYQDNVQVYQGSTPSVAISSLTNYTRYLFEVSSYVGAQESSRSSLSATPAALNVPAANRLVHFFGTASAASDGASTSSIKDISGNDYDLSLVSGFTAPTLRSTGIGNKAGWEVLSNSIMLGSTVLNRANTDPCTIHLVYENVSDASNQFLRRIFGFPQDVDTEGVEYFHTYNPYKSRYRVYLNNDEHVEIERPAANTPIVLSFAFNPSAAGTELDPYHAVYLNGERVAVMQVNTFDMANRPLALFARVTGTNFEARGTLGEFVMYPEYQNAAAVASTISGLISFYGVDAVAPDAPTLTITEGDGALTLNASDEGAASYLFYDDGTLLERETTNSHEVTGLTNGTQYGPYSVIAIDSSGNASDESSGVSGTPAVQPPTPVDSATVTIVANSVSITTATDGSGDVQHQDGDVAIIMLGYYSSSNEVEVPMGVMTSIGDSFSNGRMSAGNYYSVLDGSSRTFSLSIAPASKPIFAHIVIWRNVDTANPINASAVNNNVSFGDDTTGTPAIAPNVNGCAIMVMLTNSSWGVALTKPTLTDIEHEDAQNPPSYSGYEIQSTAAAISKTYNYAASTWYHEAIIALKPK